MTEPSGPTIWYIRHGETDWNRDRRIQGHTDIPLNETGTGQAKRAARYLAEVLPDIAGYRLFASPLARTRQTMAAVLAVYRLCEDDVTWDDRLVELGYGVMEGKSWSDIHALGLKPEIEPDKFHDWRPENGESYADGTSRVRDWLAELDRPSVVVGHGGISRILRGIVFHLPKREIVQLKVPQNRFYRIMDGGLDWFDPRVMDS